jgi:ketosteroid isomerase-like protein
MQTLEATHALNTLDRDNLEALVRAFWSERLADSRAAVLRHSDPDIVFRILGGAGRPQPCIFNGREAVLEAVRNIDMNLEFRSFEIIDLIVDGNEVALRWLASLRHRGTGVVGDLAVFELIKIERALITSYTSFLDTDGFHRLITGHPQRMFARRSNASRPHAAAASVAPANGMFDSDAVHARDRHEDMLRAFWLDRRENGSAAVARYFTDDGELHLIGDPTVVPFARSHLGLEAVQALVDQIDLEFGYESLAIEKVLIDKDRAAVHWAADVRHHGTGARGRIEALDHVILENGRIRSITEFFDTAATASWIEG